MKRLLIILSLICFLLSSCMTSNNAQKKAMQVEKGMSKAEVIKILGEPKNRSFTHEYEELEFRFVNTLYGTVKVVLVQFENDRVVGMDSFTPIDHPSPAPLPPIIH